MRDFINLVEAFDSTVPWTWHSSENEDVTEFWATFEIDDGHFRVRFKHVYYNPGVWEFSFTRNGTYELTGTGNAATVISTVMAIAREFIQEHDPRHIEFAGKNEEASRNKLYPRLLAIMAKEFPQYTLDEPRKGYKHTTYGAQRPAKPWVAPEPEQIEPAIDPKEYENIDWDEMESFLAQLDAEANEQRRQRAAAAR